MQYHFAISKEITMSLRRYLLVVIALVSLINLAYADEKRHQQLIEEYLKLTNMQKLTDASLDTQVDMMVKAYPDQYKEHRAALKRTYQRFYSWDKVKPVMIKEYMKHFSEDDMAAIIEFTKTPAGQRFVKKMPEVTKGA